MKQSKKLSKFPNLIQGFTNQDEKWSGENIVLPEQVHGNDIALAGKEDIGKMIKGADGLVTLAEDVPIGVRTADCVPILFYEPVKKIAGAVHAGWRGTQAKISQKMIDKIMSLGGDPREVLVSIGPHICVNCYNIPSERARLFPKDAIGKRGGEFYLDLFLANLNQLKETGVDAENIEILPFCTYHDSGFSSFRKSKKEGTSLSEMLSFIRLK